MQHDDNTTRMLKRISRERDFFPFLEAQADVHASNSLTQEGPTMYRSQGMALAYRALAKMLVQAANTP
ncbi:MAG: hypothetical protein V3573_14525 [Desulfovibrionaceae bacterium]